MTYKLPEGRTIRVLFHACAVQKQILSLGCLTPQEYWSDLRADAGTLFFPDKTQTNRSHTQLHKEESLFFVKWMLVAPLTTAGVSDKVAQEIQMPVGPQMLEDVEEPMLAIVSNLEDVIRHIENSRKSMQLCLHFSLIEGTWEMEGPPQIACFLVKGDTSSGAIRATMVPDSKNVDMLHVVATTAKWVCDLGCSQDTENQRHQLQPADFRFFDVCEETCTTIR